MKVEIWSDVMCPFCYIGKRKFENALEKFPNRNEVEIEWKSFQLDPEARTQPGKSVNQYLAERKGWTVEYARHMNDRVTAMAGEVGLNYDFDRAIVANSFDAHRLSHLAKRHGVQDTIEERLFKAYFTEGKNTADHTTLISIAAEAGLNADEVRAMLSGNDFVDAVHSDVYEAHRIGARGVPFFVFDKRYAVSGAQPSDVFLRVLEKIDEESRSHGVDTTPERKPKAS
ncbi:MAG: DsbA family oxidoreductase [Ignavibacteriales bacterium]|nr:DsbA family oxidoreductase [Ignavibacteriales bacterium]